MLFTNAKAGIAKRSLDEPGDSLEPLFETIVARVPEPPAEEGPFQLLISAIDHNRYVGRIGIGRIFRGTSRRNEPIVKLARDGTVTTGLRLATLLTFAGLERIDVEAGVGRRHRLRLRHRRSQHRRHDSRCGGARADRRDRRRRADRLDVLSA